MPDTQVGLHLSSADTPSSSEALSSSEARDSPRAFNSSETLSASEVPGFAEAPRRAAVLGRPISHSLSPVLHRAAYEALGLPGWSFDRIDCGADELAALVAGAGPEYVGFAVTMPAKRAALAAAAHVSSTAALVGAANTLLPGRTGWRADNTDVQGLVTTLQTHGTTAPEVQRRGPVVVLGAGGTAQAAVVALSELGFDAATVVVRDPGRTTQVAATAARAGLGLEVRSMASAGSLSRSCALLVSTVPAEGTQAVLSTPWRADLVAVDAVYAGWPTPLARSVSAAGGRAISGAHLLLRQAAAQVELMTGRPAPLDAMAHALRMHVGAALDGA